MKLYDVECPICGVLNQNLNLEETDGWFECEKCKTTVKKLSGSEYKGKTKKIPLYTPEQLAAVFSTVR